MSDKKSSYTRLWELIKDYARLTIEDTKLTVAEKVTVLVTAAALSVVGLMMCVIVLFFVSIGLAQLLGQALGLCWAYLIVAGAYLLLFIVLVLLRKPLIMNPMARFISRLFFTPHSKS